MISIRHKLENCISLQRKFRKYTITQKQQQSSVDEHFKFNAHISTSMFCYMVSFVRNHTQESFNSEDLTASCMIPQV